MELFTFFLEINGNSRRVSFAYFFPVFVVFQILHLLLSATTSPLLQLYAQVLTLFRRHDDAYSSQPTGDNCVQSRGLTKPAKTVAKVKQCNIENTGEKYDRIGVICSSQPSLRKTLKKKNNKNETETVKSCFLQYTQGFCRQVFVCHGQIITTHSPLTTGFPLTVT